MITNFSKRFFAIFMSFYLVTFLSAAQFVCSTDPIYVDYKAGNRLNLDGATKYAGENVCENNCRDYTQCEKETIHNTYYCPIREYEDLGGDAGASNFTSKSTCDGKCYSQNNCVQLIVNPCKPVDIQYQAPVTDYTGKTIFTQRSVTYKCENNETKQVGCNKWRVEVNNGSMDFNTTAPGTIWKTSTGSQQAKDVMAMLEQQLHLFSGWEGKCEHGTMFNNPFNNPMAILGYAMMIYSAAGNMQLGDTAKDLHDSVQTSFDNAADSITGSTPDVAGMDAGAGAVSIGTKTGILASIADANVFYTIPGTAFTSAIDLLYTDLAQIAMAAMVTDEEVQQGDHFIKASLGDSDADAASLAYANCMASIGLSFPNLISYSASDLNNTSPELRHVTDNPISLTSYQITDLIEATSLKYVKAAYKPINYDSDQKIVTYIAFNQAAYQQAGQVICAGKLSAAINIANHKAVTPPPSSGGGGGIGKAVGMMAAKKLLTAFLGPWGIVASVVLDLVTSLKSGNACTDPDIAIKWGLIQFKTNKFLSFNQCHFTKSECAAKWFWGSCMRTRNKYCCYDQISTRIFAEGIKQEMYPPTDPATGLPNTKMWESCNDITINDLKNISFKECTADEQPYADHCFPRDKYQEFEDAINKGGVANFDFKGAANQAINSLAIPNKVCKFK